MATDVRKLLQDAAYVTVGVGVLGFQRAQVARREARTKLEGQVKDAQTRLTTGLEGARSTARETRSKVETQLRDARSRVEPLAEQVQTRVPEAVAKAVEVGRNRLQGLTGTAA